MNDHLQACEYCPNEIRTDSGVGFMCRIYDDRSWVNRRGGCPGFPYREVPRIRGEYVDGVIMSGSQRPGQQKQKKADRQYNNAKARRKFR